MPWIDMTDVLDNLLSIFLDKEAEGTETYIQTIDGRKYAPSSAIGPKHKHRCKMTACGNIWEHEDLRLIVGDALYEELHTCPKCGAVTFFKFDPEREWFGANEDDTRKEVP